MRLPIILLLTLLYTGCKKEENQNSQIPQSYTDTNSSIELQKNTTYYPDTTRYAIVKNKFSLTSKNFNQNQIDFSIDRLEDFNLKFFNIPNDQTHIGYSTKDHRFYINQKQSKKVIPTTTKNQHLDLTIILDTIKVTLSVPKAGISISESITLTEPYIAMTFNSEQLTMTDVKISKKN